MTDDHKTNMIVLEIFIQKDYDDDFWFSIYQIRITGKYSTNQRERTNKPQMIELRLESWNSKHRGFA